MNGAYQLLPQLSSPRKPLRPLQLLKHRFRVVGPIAQSGFGALYQAQDTLFGLDVALKIALRQEHELDEITMLHEEARQLLQLHHPGIPGFIDFFEERGQWVLAQQFISGRHICTSQPLSVRQVVFVGRGLCEILQYLQREKTPPVIHRDIKPDNIMVEGTRVYLIDFGLSSHAGENDFLGGSLGFAAPEQLEAGLITPKVDIYGLGQTLRSLLTGQAPSDIANASTQPGAVDVKLLAPWPSSPLPGYDRSLALFAAMTEICAADRPEVEEVWRELSVIQLEAA